MRTFLLTVFALVLVLKGAVAQSGGTITGTIKTNQEVAADLSRATIALTRTKDSVPVKFALAGKAGAFSFENITPGVYCVTVTAVGYQKIHSGTIQLSPQQPAAVLPPLVIIPLAKSMADVTVIAKRPLIEQRIDRTILNVDASITNVGTTALEVLEKSPGITIDKDGNISLKGKDGVMVMIDGRPTQLGAADLANLLSNMPSSQLDQVEIMTNPPARFDAAGNAGIINIKTKKNKTAGYNGSASVGYSQGRYPKVNESFNFNYREGKLNLFSNFSHSHAKNFQVLTIQRNIQNSNGTALENYFDQQANMIRVNSSLNGKVGLDYFASKKTTIGIVLNGFTNDNSNINNNRTDILTAAKDLESVTNARVVNDSRWTSFSTNLNARTVFDSTGRELTSEFDYISYGSTNAQFMENAYLNSTGNPFRKADSLQGALPQHITIYSGRIDYSHPVKKGTTFEAGLKSSIVRTDNDARYDSIQNGMLVHDYNRSNHFIYEENINAAYANFNTSLSKKLSVQLGLRFENTNAKGNQLTTGEKFDLHYSQLFPTAYFQYKANAKNNFGLNYGRRIRRPNYESLNPFIRFIDRYTYSQGNPDLKPQFSHNIELTHTWRNILTTTFNYTTTNNIIQTVIEQKGQEAYTKKANIASLNQVGLSISANHSITKWWTNNIFLNVFNNSYTGVVNTTPIAFSATSLSLNGTQQFRLSKTLSGEISGGYRGPAIEGVIRMKSMGMLAAGFSKQVLKNKGTLRITVRDILYTQRARAIINYGNVDATFQERRDSRVLNLGFTYRFSKGKIANVKKKAGGSAGDEQNRVGVD